MKFLLFIAVSMAMVTGCMQTPRDARTASSNGDPSSTGLESFAGAKVAPTKGQASKAEGDPVKLEAYEVNASAFSDFGMSVKTNFEVMTGGNVEWMVVSGVMPSSSASRWSLVIGDRILAIDGRLITQLGRDEMLDAFFNRKKGEVSRVLVLGRSQALPRFVTLVASRPGT